jgi:hypothetical protein
MADTTEKETSEFEKFAEDFNEAKYQSSDAEPEEATPVEEAEPVEAEPAAEVQTSEEPEEARQGEEEPQVKLYTLPDDEMYGELRGKKVTVAQLEEAGLIGKVITRDHQEMHNTKLYQRLKEEFDAKLEERLKAAVPQAPPAQPETSVTPKDFADNLERTYVPVLRKLAEAGAFEPDFVDAYPKFASQTAHQIESMRLVGQGLVSAVSEIRNWVGMQQAERTTTSSMQVLESRMAELASNEMYAGLGDRTEREAFVNWMKSPDNKQPWKKMDIETELAMPENLAGAYSAFKAATRSTSPSSAPAGDRTKARMAAGGGGTTRQATKAPALDEFAQLKHDLEESRARSFAR